MSEGMVSMKRRVTRMKDPCRCGRAGYHRGKDERCVVCGKWRPFPSYQRRKGGVLKKVQPGPFNNPDRDKSRPEHRDGPVIITKPASDTR